jgi:UDP-N-acetylmuramate dehydrogenase
MLNVQHPDVAMMAAKVTPAVSGEIRQNEALSRHTSWRVGGPADIYFCPASSADLALFLRELDAATPVFWLGLGSNLLVRDGGIRGVVIAAAGIFNGLERVGEREVRAGSSVPCTQLARQCVRWGLGPSEFFAGIPGTVGGALAMNAGAHGGETWERVQSVTTIDRQGVSHQRKPGEYRIGYRSVTGPANEWFLDALLEFDAGAGADPDVLKQMLARRKATQPLGLPSCGSVFRNPPGDHAARLIEAAGLKGYRLGGAEVSTKHANFIINRDQASAADIEALIKHVRQTVQDVHGVALVHEVHIVGETAA